MCKLNWSAILLIMYARTRAHARTHIFISIFSQKSQKGDCNFPNLQKLNINCPLMPTVPSAPPPPPPLPPSPSLSLSLPLCPQIAHKHPTITHLFVQTSLSPLTLLESANFKTCGQPLTTRSALGNKNPH